MSIWRDLFTRTPTEPAAKPPAKKKRRYRSFKSAKVDRLNFGLSTIPQPIDYDLPDLKGDAVANALSAHDPATALILHSARDFDPDDPVRTRFDFYVQKPVLTTTRLERTVRIAASLRSVRLSRMAPS